MCTYLDSLPRVPLRPGVLDVHVQVAAAVDEPHLGPHLVREVRLVGAQVDGLLVHLVVHQVHPEGAAPQRLPSEGREAGLAAQGQLGSGRPLGEPALSGSQELSLCGKPAEGVVQGGLKI